MPPNVVTVAAFVVELECACVADPPPPQAPAISAATTMVMSGVGRTGQLWPPARRRPRVRAGAFVAGGGPGWIRTIEGCAGRFTGCSLCPLGHRPMWTCHDSSD